MISHHKARDGRLPPWARPEGAGREAPAPRIERGPADGESKKKRKREERGDGILVRDRPPPPPSRAAAGPSLRRVFRDRRLLRQILERARAESPEDPAGAVCRRFQELASEAPPAGGSSAPPAALEALMREPDPETGAFALDDLLGSAVDLASREAASHRGPGTVLLDAYVELVGSLEGAGASPRPAHRQPLVRLLSASPCPPPGAALLAAAERLARWDAGVLYRPSGLTGCLPLHAALRRCSLGGGGGAHHHCRMLHRFIQIYRVASRPAHPSSSSPLPPPPPPPPPAWTRRNRLGELPLHVACRSGAPLSVLRQVLEQTAAESAALLGAPGDRSGRGSAAQGEPGRPRDRPDPWIWSADRAGHTPVDLLWQRHVDGDEGDAYLPYRPREPPDGQAEDGSKWTRDVRGRLLRRAVDQWAAGSGASRDGSAAAAAGALAIEPFLDRAALVVRAAWADPGDRLLPEGASPDLLLLHRASAMAPSLPRPVLDAFLRRARAGPNRSTEDALRSRDGRGRTPLHFCLLSLAPLCPSATEAPRQQRSRRPSPGRDREARAWEEWIRHLVRLDPGLVRVADDDGRLPLHYALLMPLGRGSAPGTDDDATSAAEAAAAASAVDRVVSDVLVRLHPEAAQVVDRPTGLYPFHLAALAGSGASVDRAYELLRLCPHALDLAARQRGSMAARGRDLGH